MRHFSRLFMLMTVCTALSCKTPTTPQFMKDSSAKPLKPGITVRDMSWAGANYRVISVDTAVAKLQMLSSLSTQNEVHNFKTLGHKLASRSKVPVFIVNAGMFHKNMEPVGLYIENGTTFVPINLDAGGGNFFMKPNGVFALNRNGPQIVVSEKWAGKAEFATQSGPMLVVDGAIHPSFAEDSTNLNIRSGVGVTDSRFVHLVLSLQAVNLYNFAAFFKSVIGCANALYLDGHISQALIPGVSNPFPQREFGTFIFAE